MANSAELYNEANSVLAQIKGNADKAQVRELQRQYAKLSRLYTKAVRAEWAQAPAGAVA